MRPPLQQSDNENGKCNKSTCETGECTRTTSELLEHGDAEIEEIEEIEDKCERKIFGDHAVG